LDEIDNTDKYIVPFMVYEYLRENRYIKNILKLGLSGWLFERYGVINKTSRNKKTNGKFTFRKNKNHPIGKRNALGRKENDGRHNFYDR